MSFEKATIAGLVAFINSQPAGRVLDHSSGWFDCAVGHYSKERMDRDPINYLEGQAGTVYDLFREVGSAAVHSMWGFPTTFEPTVMDYLRLEVDGKDTYGQLRTALAERFPEMGFSQKAPVIICKPAWFTTWSKEKFAELVG